MDDQPEVIRSCPECRGAAYFYKHHPATWDDPGYEESFACNECGGLGYEFSDDYAAASRDAEERLDDEDYDNGYLAPLMVAA